MEVLLVWGGIFLLIWWVRSSMSIDIDAILEQEDLEPQASRMKQLEMVVESGTVGDGDLPVWKVKIRGLFPLNSTRNLTVITSLFDVTDKDNPLPLLAAMEDFQEDGSRAFQFRQNLGMVEPGQGFLHWVDAGIVPKELLMFPLSGHRKIAFVARLVDQDNLPEISWGFPENKSGIIQEYTQNQYIDAKHGFRERSEEELGIAAASIRMGLAVAFSDGSFDPLEGRLIKEWAAKFVDEVPEGPGRNHAKAFINDTIRYGVEDAKNNDLSISSQVSVLNKLSDKPEKYAAMELCLDVMAADGTADNEELKMLNRLCESLDLDSEHFNKLKDHRMMGVESPNMDNSNIWETLSINSSLTNEKKAKELRQLYRKWNARAESLENPQEREKAHKMIELIAEARKSLSA